MRKTILILLFSFLALTEAQAKTANGLKVIKSVGAIFFGTEGTYAPYNFHNKNNNLVGFDVDIAQAVATKLGVQAKFIEGRWDGLIAGLDSKRYDAVINQVGITPERQAKYDFSKPYINSKIVLITRDDNTTIKNFSDLKGQKSAQSLISNYSQLAGKYGADIVYTDNFNQSLELLLTGRVDATLNDNLSFLNFKKQKPNAKVKVIAYEAVNAPVAILLRKGQPELVTAINKALDDIKADGTYKSIFIKYFGHDISNNASSQSKRVD